MNETLNIDQNKQQQQNNDHNNKRISCSDSPISNTSSSTSLSINFVQPEHYFVLKKWAIIIWTVCSILIQLFQLLVALRMPEQSSIELQKRFFYVDKHFIRRYIITLALGTSLTAILFNMIGLLASIIEGYYLTIIYIIYSIIHALTIMIVDFDLNTPFLIICLIHWSMIGLIILFIIDLKDRYNSRNNP
ncbi:uncharacterized protein LOC113789638 [Dermatophagoides pteronyssinus]|uniref:uncharacterized protein LOC113789638 n=1 Tax=Dermatophagoides pteronyssinus TaxID=6956 RepID=UPI003F663964